MSGFRAQSQNMEFPAPLKFCTSLVYHTSHPKEVMDEANYFLNCQSLLNAGDEIKACCVRDDETWDKAIYEVLQSEHGSVIVNRIEEWRHSMAATGDVFTIEHKGFGKWEVRNQHNTLIRSGIKKAEAEQYLASEGAETEAA